MPFEGQVGGHILLAIARDENDNIFPVALGVVEQENKDSWRSEERRVGKECSDVCSSDLIQICMHYISHISS